LGQVALRHRGRHFGDVAQPGRSRFDAIELTESVRSFHVAGHALQLRPARPTSLRTHFAGHACDFAGETRSNWSTMVLMVSFNSRISPFHVDGDLLGTGFAVGDGPVVTSAMLRHLTGEIRGPCSFTFSVQVLPGGPATPRHVSPAPPSRPSEPTSRGPRASPRTRNAFQLVHHRIDGFLQFQDLARQHRHRGSFFARLPLAMGPSTLRRCCAPGAVRLGRPSNSRCRSNPSTCPRRPRHPEPGRPVALRCRPSRATRVTFARRTRFN